jgi:hypothetical protein
MHLLCGLQNLGVISIWHSDCFYHKRDCHVDVVTNNFDKREIQMTRKLMFGIAAALLGTAMTTTPADAGLFSRLCQKRVTYCPPVVCCPTVECCPTVVCCEPVVYCPPVVRYRPVVCCPPVVRCEPVCCKPVCCP